MNLVQNRSIFYLDCCFDLLTDLSASILHPTSFFSMRQSKRAFKTQHETIVCPTPTMASPRSMPWPSGSLQSSPSSSLQSHLYFSFPRLLSFKPTTFLIFLNMPSMLLWRDLCTCRILSPVIYFLWLAPSLHLDLSSVVMFSESASINTPFYYFHLRTCSFFSIT